MKINIGFSDFAIERHKKGTGYSYFTCSKESIIIWCYDHWNNRVKGDGDCSINDVCIIIINDKFLIDYFVSTKILLSNITEVSAWLEKRQENEDKFIRVGAKGKSVETKYVKIILYSAKELLKNNGKRSGDYDWEIVSIIVTDDLNEPMRPLAMARNFLGETGGTPREYTAKQFAESIWYWSHYVSSIRE